MADFNAKINLDADNNKALRKIQQVEKAVNKLDDAVNKVQVKVIGTKTAEQQVNKLYKALERLESRALSKLPQSLQMVIVYLKAANAGIDGLIKRAALASAAMGDIGRVSLAPIVRAQTQVITQFNQTGSAIQKVNTDIVRLSNTFDILLARIVAVRIEIEGIRRLTGGGGGGFLGGGRGGGGGGGGGGGRGQLPPADFSFLGDPITLRGLRNLRSNLQDLLDTTVIGSSQFRKLEEAIGQVNNKINDAQLLGQRGGSGVAGRRGAAAAPAVVPGSILALEAELAAKQKLVNNAKIGSRAFQKYSRELQKTTRQLERAQSAGKGFFSNLTNPQSKLGSAVIGGGFPLITGGGPGSVLGGALGGLAGGFAGSIGGSAIGQVFDQTIAKVIEVGEVTRSTGNAYDFLKDKQLFSTDAIRDRADALAEQGRVEELAALATKELVQLIGNEGVQNLNKLDDEWQELLSNITELGLAIAGFISKYLGPVIGILNDAVGNVNQINRFNALTSENAEAKAFYDSILGEVNKRGRLVSGLSAADARAATLEKFDIKVDPKSNLPVTDEDRDRFAPKTDKAADQLERQLAAGEKLARQFRQRVELLNAENDLQEKLIRITQQREEAEIRIKETAAASQQAALLQANSELGELERKKAIQDFVEKQLESSQKLIEATNQAAANDLRRKELLEQGINPALADALIKIENQFDKEREVLDAALKVLDAEILRAKANGAITDELEKQRKELEKAKGLLDEAEGKAKKKAEKDNPGAIQAYIDQLQAELNDTEAMIVSLAKSVQSAMATAIGEAVTSLVDGSKKIEETLADMFKAIGKAFIQMAAEIIAKQLIMIALQAILKALGGGSFTMSNGSTGNFATPDAAGFNALGGAIPTGYAEGGFVTRPTAAVVGEGGQGEYVIPADRMAGAMERYNAGVRGEAVVDGADSYGTGGGATAGASPITLNVTATEIGGENFVKVNDLQAALAATRAQATADGAKQGEARAMRRLQMSPGSRRKVGI